MTDTPYIMEKSLVQRLRENDEAEIYLSSPERRELLKKQMGKERKAKTYSTADVTCLTLILLGSSPWTGLWIATKFTDAMQNWHAFIK